MLRHKLSTAVTHKSAFDPTPSVAITSVGFPKRQISRGQQANCKKYRGNSSHVKLITRDLNTRDKGVEC
jgi:hypothetical protein